MTLWEWFLNKNSRGDKNILEKKCSTNAQSTKQMLEKIGWKLMLFHCVYDQMVRLKD